MRRMLISLAATAALTAGAYAQSPATAPEAPAAPAPGAAAPAQPPAKADAAAPTDTSSQTKGDGTATQWTYKTKDGQMYEPPKQRPASPAMDLGVYGRT